MYQSAESYDQVNDIISQPSEIQQHFAGSTIFVTGGTGFLGKLLVEKLLRTCTDVNKIYILMRPKKNNNSEKRFQEYFDDVLYDRLKNEQPKAINKVFAISGDCALPDLGISEEDRQTMTSEVTCIFHLAATVRFNENIRTAAHINVRGTRDILRMAKQMKKLNSFVYVSTAFAFCPRENINEEFYEPAFTANQLLTIVETLRDDQLDSVTTTLLGKWPNEYNFTKSIAENIVKEESTGLPICVVRPSIVVGTATDPLPGWIDNFYGATGVFAAGGRGLLRVLYCKPEYLLDIVPADYVVNSFIAAAWNTAKSKDCFNTDPCESNESDITIYNYVSGPQNPITIGKSVEMGFHYGDLLPSYLQVWYPFLLLVPNKRISMFLHYILHILPAHIVDFLTGLIRKQPQLVTGYDKISKFMDVLTFFVTRQFIFNNQNTQELWNKLNLTDRKLFEFDMAAINWNTYFYYYIQGVRVYILKDPIDTMPKALRKAFKLKTICRKNKRYSRYSSKNGTSLLAAIGLGLVRVLYCKPDYIVDLVPADYVVNSLIAAAWNTAKSNGDLNNTVSEPRESGERDVSKSTIPIYNYVSSPQNPITLRKIMERGFHYGDLTPSYLQVWYPCLLLIPNKHIALILHYMLHILPAYIVDFLTVLIRKQPQLVKGYAKISKLLDVLSYFISRQWIFKNQNTQELWNKLNLTDRKLFEFDMAALNWYSYFQYFIQGVRVYILKDPMDTVPKALSRAFKLKVAHYCFVGVLILLFFKVFLFLWGDFF